MQIASMLLFSDARLEFRFFSAGRPEKRKRSPFMFVCVLDEHLNAPKNGRKEEKEGIGEEDLWPL